MLVQGLPFNRIFDKALKPAIADWEIFFQTRKIFRFSETERKLETPDFILLL